MDVCPSGGTEQSSKEYQHLHSTILSYLGEKYADQLNELQQVHNETSNLSSIEKYNKCVEILMSVLLKDLLDEEDSFMEYLDRAVKDIDYERRANYLFQTIRNEHKEDRKSNWYGTSGGPGISVYPKTVILSFNYTNFEHSRTDNVFANLNGSLKDHNAIFGIPDTCVTDDNANWDFTKTSQSAVHELPPNNRQLAMSTIQNSEHVNSVNIFGHSLQQPDDPYFFDIFNKANIMNEYTPIRFYFTELGNRPFDRKKLIKDVRMLFMRYDTKKGANRFADFVRHGFLTFDKLNFSLE